MKTVIVVGSHRVESQSAKVGRYIAHHLSNTWKHEVQTIDLGKNPLPLWDESRWDKDPKWDTIWGGHSKILAEAGAFVIIAPEYAGMVPAALKNFFLMCDRKELAHKPALIVGVSSSRGGAYPVAELRSSSYKNTFVCYLPEHIIVRDAESILNDLAASAEGETDRYIRGRIRYALGLLDGYATGLKTVREMNLTDYKSYPNGM